MKTMKKLVAALLVLTMVLALAGSAFAACSLKKGDYVKFTGNYYGYKAYKGAKSATCVKKGSIAQIVCVRGSWIKLNLSSSTDYVIYGWFKTDMVKASAAYADTATGIRVFYSDGGKGLSVAGQIVDDKNTSLNLTNKKYIKVTGGTVNIHKTNSLSGKIIARVHKGDKLTYLHKVGGDDRDVIWYKVKVNGKCGWISDVYGDPVCK